VSVQRARSPTRAQSLIFVREPYYNEPGYERLAGTEKGNEYSRQYNDHVTYATMQFAIREQMANAPEYFKVGARTADTLTAQSDGHQLSHLLKTGTNHRTSAQMVKQQCRWGQEGDRGRR
jgi:hypothetical protein